MHRPLKLAAALAGAFLMGCAEEPAEIDETAPDTAAMVETAELSLADFAGTWTVRNEPQSGADTTATIFQLEVTADEWTLHFPGREPIVARTTVAGDSVVADAGPFESVRRAGVMVTTHSVYRLDGDRLVGTTVARYTDAGADSVLVLVAEGTRVP